MFPNGQKYHSIAEDELVGRIDYDDSNPSVPMVVIDGHPYTWEQLGRMAMSYEGSFLIIRMLWSRFCFPFCM
ncbi:hypothetical protein [Bacillus sp. THAF10]|uniref:DUF7713 domain-containing protein n=1 Tax=Bacillus sp. THAF10 TaxID=2587848 RepID=UPI001268A650|nr:hypothetical protein [Bacillus sp. THAF10]